MITKRIIITEDFKFSGDGEQIIEDYDHSVADTLREIARLLDEGYTSGYEPNWHLEGVHADE